MSEEWGQSVYDRMMKSTGAVRSFRTGSSNRRLTWGPDSTSRSEQSSNNQSSRRESQSNQTSNAARGQSDTQQDEQRSERPQGNTHDAMETDLEDPLLREYGNDEDGSGGKDRSGGPPGPPPNSPSRKSSVLQTSENLANTVVGAGIMSLPHAIASLGVVFGSFMLLLAYYLARLSLDKLIRMTQSFQAQSYSQLVRKGLGRSGDVLLQASIILNNAGILVVYLIILGDITVGSPPKYDGLLSTWFGLHSGQHWYLDRPFVVALLAAFFLLPLSLLRDLSVLSKVSACSLALVGFFTTAMTYLGALAIFKGSPNGLDNVRWWPSLEELTHPKSLLALVSTIPVLATSFVCHYNLHPMMKDLSNYTPKKMIAAVDIGLGGCTGAFLLSGISGYFLFNGHPSEDVLKSFTPANLAPLLGDDFASITQIAIRCSYLLVLLCHAPIVSFGLRDLLLEIIFPDQEIHGGAYTGVTLVIVALAYVASVVLPNVWTFLQVTGATASMTLAYIVPAMLMLKLEKAGSQRGVGGLVLAGSVFVSVLSIVQTASKAV